MVPAAIAVTNPVLLTVATKPFEDVQGLVADGVPDPESWEVLVIQADSVPVTVGDGFTVNDTVTGQPLLFV